MLNSANRRLALGIIHDHVFRSHLSKFPTEREFLLPFLTNFDATFAQRRVFKGTEISVYLLNPDQTIQDQFGITSEIVMAISDFKTMQPRTVQAIDDFFASYPAKGRVDQTLFFIVTKGDCREWLLNHCAVNQQPRIPIAISYSEINDNRSDQWFARKVMSKQLYARDLFNEQLPLISDQYFFGRERLVSDFVNAAKTSHNRGLFGLRKTGKTSLLFKFRRIVEEDDVVVLYYDCKDPSIRSLGWVELLHRICDEILRETKRSRSVALARSDIHVSERFRAVVQSTTNRCCIIFDEIEYISPIAKLDPHWKSDFIPFWQTIWTTQSQTRRLSFVIAGVNPSVVETDLVDGVQNPIFAIISPEYLTGLSNVETRSMLHFFGKRMGLKFDHTSADYIFERYGGHPMLTRMAGSFVNSAAIANDLVRPTPITKTKLVEEEGEREDEMAFYCRHIINELRIFYPDEYVMLELLASGNSADFIELARDKNLLRHLESYGLVQYIKGQVPTIRIPVLSQFINSERMKREQSSQLMFVVEDEARLNWLANRKIKIVSDSRSLEGLSSRASASPIYGPNGFPETEYFADMPLSNDRAQFTDFINICNRCLVESISNLGKSVGKRNYLNEDIKNEYPDLYDALVRVRLYRNNVMHLLLFDSVDAQLQDRLSRDFMGQRISDLGNPYALFQQVVLDGLFVGFQMEIDKRS